MRTLCWPFWRGLKVVARNACGCCTQRRMLHGMDDISGAARTWLADQRQLVRRQVAVLEDRLFDLGVEPAGAPAVGEDADSYLRQVGRYEQHVQLLRRQLLAAGAVPPDMPLSSGDLEGGQGVGRASGRVPSDWLERLNSEQQARRAAEVRAEQQAAARRQAEGQLQRLQRVVPQLSSLVAETVLPDVSHSPTSMTSGSGSQQQGVSEAESRSTMELTQLVLQAYGRQVPLSSSEVTDAVNRVADEPVKPGTVRANLSRLRDRGEVALDEDRGVWWLVDPDEPTWQPPDSRPLRVVTDHR